MKKGKFITFEGADAAGKSTQTRLLAQYLAQKNIQVLQTREPGGTAAAEQIREIVLSEEKLDGISETLLMFAARREHIVDKIKPALAAGQWVICDRFTDSTIAYQGGGRNVSLDFIGLLAQHVQDMIVPDLTFYLQSPPQTSANPLFAKETFERESTKFYERVANAYKTLAEQHPHRIISISYKNKKQLRRDEDSISEEIQQIINKELLSSSLQSCT